MSVTDHSVLPFRFRSYSFQTYGEFNCVVKQVRHMASSHVSLEDLTGSSALLKL